MIAVAGRFIHTAVSTTVGALFDGEPLLAKPCDTGPIKLPAGQQELLVSPGAAFIVDGVQLAGPLAADAGPSAKHGRRPTLIPTRLPPRPDSGLPITAR